MTTRPPFADFAPPIREQDALRQAITAAYRRPEQDCIAALLPQATLPDAARAEASTLARRLVEALRARPKGSGVDQLVQEFALSTQEGVALMCLAEALLRIPDDATRDALIRDKIAGGDWRAHIGGNRSLFVNAATWGLVVTGKLTASVDDRNLGNALTRLIARAGEPIIRRGVDLAMRMMGEQFVTGRTIEEALERARELEAKGFRYSYDMLGEAAMTADDAARYLADYENAIRAIGRASAGRGIVDGPGISIKLSALHPRYARAQADRVMSELLPRVKGLCELAKRFDIGLNIDAEEADRLELSLDLLESLALDPDLAGWNGLGFVVQGYGKRCPHVIDWIVALARRSGRRIMVRLVKGAYWDAEIKRAQVDGLADFPVYTRKVHTDVAYIACARRLLDAPDAVFPQFATHNAHTLATIYAMAGPDFASGAYEFQCLHGMGEPLYEEVVGADKLDRPCRIYAPVGTHETLLAYLVRRLLENGANSSFVNRIANEAVPVEEIIADPVEQVRAMPIPGAPHPNIALPGALYPGRRNSRGVDLSSEAVLADLAERFAAASREPVHAAPSPRLATLPARPVRNPAEHDDTVGTVADVTAEAAREAVRIAAGAAATWASTPINARATCLERGADALEAAMPDLLALIVREAGKSVPNAVAEVREAVDFLRYYAVRARSDLAGSTPLGPVVCISPWNFPLAIFTGQVAAALVAGNPVLAKPAEETPLIAAEAVRLLHAAGVPADVLQFVPGDGAIGAALVGAPETAGVMFTGSTDVGRLIQKQLSTRLSATGRPIPLIAETGGQNAMIVDSSALAEQVVADVIASAFDSAGQRCSALRVLCLQEDVADRVLAMLKGALAELRIGRTDRLAADIGPVITAEAQARIEAHVDAMRARGRKVERLPLPDGTGAGTFVAPTIIELEALSDLEQEVFGPVLHVIRYRRQDIDALVDAINAWGFGLTFGLHTRLDDTIARVTSRIHVGNIYVNRNVIGAVVGVQPFGGHGLSGTGPKAGGPLYLQRLVQPRPALPFPVDAEVVLPGPVGEHNLYRTGPAGRVILFAQDGAALAAQVEAATAHGNTAVIADSALLPSLPSALAERVLAPADWRQAGPFARALVHGDGAFVAAVQKALATLPGPIVTAEASCATGGYAPAMLVGEQSVSINTTAAGGNASLMTLA
ncbi:bifunctional proline dehydrogenase/L-glutamate gamma-semialdehyde dehydrogenase PutA [Novosphingobium sp. NBM11]|uniref:bifunctional proline dehydrogenase/L-glutamate gamma-semialdehyde dehydrogenase PutA n=1 Tax=Novosphingobium sp. NBM11 TaxID=2596914 RepID=UPI001892129D|nr:bifunctional proline dehydrogenase/L-glutamate gamma-semialdehyde dehydrogenase PutA [Novosphingobium sp. NBM11]MBF5091794.1 bifunctional proline dehydrogenase/L-glutamate gamma-semialdehyde dehydrogenase PutA [Novosphingobium sp. NBM11]